MSCLSFRSPCSSFFLQFLLPVCSAFWFCLLILYTVICGHCLFSVSRGINIICWSGWFLSFFWTFPLRLKSDTIIALGMGTLGRRHAPARAPRPVMWQRRCRDHWRPMSREWRGEERRGAGWRGEGVLTMVLGPAAGCMSRWWWLG